MTILTTTEQILPLIPDGEPLKTELQEFQDVLIELPEDNDRLWRQAQAILAKHIAKFGPWPTDWRADVVNAWLQRVERVELEPVVASG